MLFPANRALSISTRVSIRGVSGDLNGAKTQPVVKVFAKRKGRKFSARFNLPRTTAEIAASSRELSRNGISSKLCYRTCSSGLDLNETVEALAPYQLLRSISLPRRIQQRLCTRLIDRDQRATRDGESCERREGRTQKIAKRPLLRNWLQR